jgi:hypothetical protein
MNRGQWRMRLTVASLGERDVALGELAGLYQSEAAFSRAFERVVGVSPGTVRRGAEVASLGRT